MAKPLSRWHGLDEDQSVRPGHHQVLGPRQTQAHGAAPLSYGKSEIESRRLLNQAQQAGNPIP